MAHFDDPAAPPLLPPGIADTVRIALAEDVGTGDVTATLVPAATRGHAHVLTREDAVLCGTAWFEETFAQAGGSVDITWYAQDGAAIGRDSVVCRIAGPWRTLLTAERTALNFLQTLSGTATVTRAYVRAIAGTGARLLDTRKTLPGLRAAQKYAVRCAGAMNHRVGLYDGILIKENHVAALGSVAAAVAAARALGRSLPIEIEVETLDQLEAAIAAGADIALLDNFALDALPAAVALGRDRIVLEASGGLDLEQLRAVAATGVDFISVGALTKHLHAVDFSLRYD